MVEGPLPVPDGAVPNHQDHSGAPVSPTATGERAHHFLRQGTRRWHDEVDAAYGRFDLGTVEGLAAFLIRQARVLFPLENELERCRARLIVSDWAQRRRSAALDADLSSLGIARPAPIPVPPLPSRLHALGALYVLEGSKLGGLLLHRRVLSSPDFRVRAAGTFLGQSDRADWGSFLSILNAVPLTAPNARALLDGAQVAFGLFQVAAIAES